MSVELSDFMPVEFICNSVTDIFTHTIELNWGRIQAEAKRGNGDQ
jgi:hypothetical protein